MSKKAPMDIHNLRLPAGTDTRADGLIDHLQETAPEVGSVTRATVLRVATLRGLAAMERDRDRLAREAVPAPGKGRS